MECVNHTADNGMRGELVPTCSLCRCSLLLRGNQPMNLISSQGYDMCFCTVLHVQQPTEAARHVGPSKEHSIGASSWLMQRILLACRRQERGCRSVAYQMTHQYASHKIGGTAQTGKHSASMYTSLQCRLHGKDHMLCIAMIGSHMLVTLTLLLDVSKQHMPCQSLNLQKVP